MYRVVITNEFLYFSVFGKSGSNSKDTIAGQFEENKISFIASPV